MLTANQEQLRTVLAFLADEPPVLCDWLPWNHTFGGNHNFGLTLYNGGTLYIDAGAPTPAGFATTAANLREIATTAYFNVPRATIRCCRRSAAILTSSPPAACRSCSTPPPDCGRRSRTASIGWPPRPVGSACPG